MTAPVEVEEPTKAEEDASPLEVLAEEETGGDFLSAKAEKKQEKPQETVPMMCAFDKDRECNATCTAFYMISTGAGATWGCKRLG